MSKDLLTALIAVLPYAESRAEDIHEQAELLDTPEAYDLAAQARTAVDKAQALVKAEQSMGALKTLRPLPQVCSGTMANGPGKLYVRCTVCHRVDYEKNEGDRCNAPL